MSNKATRLSKYVIPSKYKIFLHPDLNRFVFDGKVSIVVDVKKPTKEVLLHSKDLSIHSCLVDGEEVSFKLDKKEDLLVISLKKSLSAGKHTITIDFDGVLNDLLRGFYRSKYMHEGQDRWLATTQFEPTDARRCVPCFDEPEFKAVFDVSLLVPKALQAISNGMPKKITEYDEERHLVEFTSTPKMSTYLLAFIIGDFEWIEKKTKRGVLMRVFTTKGNKNKAKFALDTGIKCVDFFEEYFGVKYPLNTLDMIAIPDFSAGAMENFGAITYRESALLFDEDNSSSANKQWVALVIAHEIAHQWFGNLATMKWWTHLWLNEGFATYLEYVAIDAIYPKMKVFEQFVSNEVSRAMSLDELATTHPIEVPVEHPDQISEIFDEVSYAKGSSVIRMLAEYLGEKHFRKGLSKYIKTHIYSNASTEDLWKAFEDASDKPVKKMMNLWTSQAGFPLVKIVDKDKKLLLSQERFFVNKISQKKAKDKAVWSIPLSILDQQTSKTSTLLMTKKEMLIDKPKEGFKFNTGESAFARFDYPTQLSEKIDIKKLSPLDRLGLIKDLRALVKSTDYPVVSFLADLEKFKSDFDLHVAEEVIASLYMIDLQIKDEDFYSSFVIFAKEILSVYKQKVSFDVLDSEGHDKKLFRTLVLSALVNFDDQEIIAQGQAVFASGNVHPDIRGVIYLAESKRNNKDTFTTLTQRHQKSDLAEEKNRILRAMCSFENKGLINDTLQYIFSDRVRTQDKPLFFSSLMSNHTAKSIVYSYIKDNYSKLLEMYGNGGSLLSRIIDSLAYLNTEEDYKDAKAFFAKKKLPSAENSFKQALEKIETKAQWRKTNLQKLSTHFKKTLD